MASWRVLRAAGVALGVGLGVARAGATPAWALAEAKLRDAATPAAVVRDLLAPLALATKVSYTGDEGEAFPGFAPLLEVSPDAGMHAVAFRALRDRRVIVAFRGTTSQADKCADDVLWAPGHPLAKACAPFSSADLDYSGQATAFVASVLRAVGAGADVALTGHSLGCTLAQLMAAKEWTATATRPRAICFAPGGVETIVRREGLNATLAAKALAFRHPFDPVVGFPPHHQLGTLCAFQGVREPLPCRFCDTSQAPVGARKSVSCELCFARAHIFQNYLDLLKDMSRRPVCAPATTVSAHDDVSGGEISSPTLAEVAA